MSNYIQKFDTQADYNAAEHDYPNVSYIVSGDSIVFAESAPEFGGLTVTYYIEDPTVEVTLFGGGGSSSSSESSSESGGGGAMPTRMIVDGVEETPINTWRFPTSGTHIVEYTFENGFMNVNFGADYASLVTKAVYGEDITSIDSYDWSIMNSFADEPELYFKTSTPPTIVDSSGTTNTPSTVYVPADAITTYESAEYWQNVQTILPIPTN